MVRDATRRSDKYAAKIVGDVVKNRIDAQKDFMVDQAKDQFALITAKELQAAALLDDWGVVSISKPFYLSYIRKLYGIVRRHSGATRVQEACISTSAFIERDLDPYYLMTLAQTLYGIDVSACTA